MEKQTHWYFIGAISDIARKCPNCAMALRKPRASVTQPRFASSHMYYLAYVTPWGSIYISIDDYM